MTCCGRKGGYLDLVDGCMLQTIESLSLRVPLWPCISASSRPCKLAAGFCEVILNMLIASGALHPVKTSALELLTLPGHIPISEMTEKVRENIFSPTLPWHLPAALIPLPGWDLPEHFGKNNAASLCRFAALEVRAIKQKDSGSLFRAKQGISDFICAPVCPVCDREHAELSFVASSWSPRP